MSPLAPFFDGPIPFRSFVLFLSFLFSSCSYEEGGIEDLNGVWEKDRVLNFRPVVEDSSSSYELLFYLRHAYGFGEKYLKFKLRIKSPSGKRREFIDSVQVRKKGGKQLPEYLGECVGDFCELRSILVEELRFSEKGKYRIDIRQRTRMKKITGISEAGIFLRK